MFAWYTMVSCKIRYRNPCLHFWIRDKLPLKAVMAFQQCKVWCYGNILCLSLSNIYQACPYCQLRLTIFFRPCEVLFADLYEKKTFSFRFWTYKLHHVSSTLSYFFLYHQFFSKPLELLLRNLHFLLTIIVVIAEQENITLWKFLLDLWPSVGTEPHQTWWRFLYHPTFVLFCLIGKPWKGQAYNLMGFSNLNCCLKGFKVSYGKVYSVNKLGNKISLIQLSMVYLKDICGI